MGVFGGLSQGTENGAVHVLEFVTKAGEELRTPSSGYHIGDGKTALVLFVDDDSLTIKYTREDNVVWGYTLHVEGICVEPNLLAVYESMNAAGRSSLPALRSGQAFGCARGNEIRVAIRDTGTFMEPRRHEDWWRDWHER